MQVQIIPGGANYTKFMNFIIIFHSKLYKISFSKLLEATIGMFVCN